MRPNSPSRGPSRPVGPSDRRGFTLVELLVVVSILALLITILMPSLTKAKEHADRAKCLATLRTLNTSLHLYTADNNTALPVTPYWWGMPEWALRKAPPGTDRQTGLCKYLQVDPIDLRCRGAQQDGWPVTVPHRRFAISTVCPVYTVNRTIISYGPLGNYPHAPKWERCMQTIDRAQRASEDWTFADGDWRGVFSAYQLNMFTEGRFFWSSHFDGVDVGYLDQHADWVSDKYYSTPGDWPSVASPPNDWCAMKSWHTMWE